MSRKPFASSEDQVMLADNLNRMLTESNEFSRRRARLSGTKPNRIALWKSLAEQGVIAAAFSETRGGFAGDSRTLAVVMAEMGAALVVEPYLAAAVIAGRILDRWTDRKSSQELIDAIISGDLICVLAHNAQFDPFAIAPLQVNSRADNIILTGSLRGIRHGDIAQSFLVPIQTGDQSVLFYRLERDHPKLSIDAYRLIDAAGAADLQFDQVVVPESARLTLTETGNEVLREVVNWGILGVAAETAGIIGALNSTTFSYLNTRKQFGAPLATFQSLQHRAADMWVASEELAAVVEVAIEAMNASSAARRATILSATKVVADAAGRRVGNESVQMHGGMGVSDELIVSHYFRRLAAIRNEWGQEDSHLLRIRNPP